MYLELRNRRLNKDWTLSYVASEIGVSKQTIHDIEIGRRKPSYNVLIALEDLFKADHRQLLTQSKTQITKKIP